MKNNRFLHMACVLAVALTFAGCASSGKKKPVRRAATVTVATAAATGAVAKKSTNVVKKQVTPSKKDK